MSKLVTHLGGRRGCLGLSLRGSCTTAADATQLEQAIGQLLSIGTPQLWVDCQQLRSLSETGERALLQADRRARAQGSTCHWCGLPGHLRTQLLVAGLQLLPAAGFRGPGFLLPKATERPSYAA